MTPKELYLSIPGNPTTGKGWTDKYYQNVKRMQMNGLTIEAKEEISEGSPPIYGAWVINQNGAYCPMPWEMVCNLALAMLS